jgi:hypothetical protein
MATLVITIDPNSLPMHSAALYVNETKIRINSKTQTSLQIPAGDFLIRINDKGIKLLPTKLKISNGETLRLFIGVRKPLKSNENLDLINRILQNIKSTLDFDLELYILQGS